MRNSKNGAFKHAAPKPSKRGATGGDGSAATPERALSEREHKRRSASAAPHWSRPDESVAALASQREVADNEDL